MRILPASAFAVLIAGPLPPQVPLTAVSTSTSTSDQHMAVDGQTIAVAWCDGRNGGFSDVYLNRSDDAGRTWMPTDVQAGHAPSNMSKRIVGLLSRGSTVLIFVDDNRSGVGAIHCSRSVDGGTTWAPQDILVSGPLNVSGSVGVFWHEGVVHFACRNNLNGVAHARSTDGGATWSSLTSLGTASTFQDGGVASITAASDGTVFVLWNGTSSRTFPVMLSRSTDAGATWLAPVRVDDGPTGNIAYRPQDARIVTDAGRVHVLWTDNRVSGNRRVRFVSSTDGGVTWPATSLVLDSDASTAFPSEPQITASGGHVHVVWHERLGAIESFRYQSSTDAGMTWMPTDIAIERSTMSALSGQHRVFSQGPFVVVGWNTDGTILFNRSIDAGASWLATDQLVGNGDAKNNLADCALVEGRLHALVGRNFGLHDGRTTHAMPFGSQPYGIGHPGSGGHVPQCSVVGTPLVGAAIEVQLEQALGSTLWFLLGGTNGPADIPVGPWTLLVEQPELWGAGITTGGFWRAGAGTASRTLQIPSLPELLGTRFNLQALFFDPRAEWLFSHTAGREVWLM